MRRFVLALALAVAFLALPDGQGTALARLKLDGEFRDWDGQANLGDPQEGAAAPDIAALYWGTNDGESAIYFMAERWPPDSLLDEARYRLYLDMDNDGVYEEPGDFRVDVIYTPDWRPNRKGYVQVWLYSYTLGGYTWWDVGRWGEPVADGALRCEWRVPFDKIGHTPGQAIRMYLTGWGANPDRLPDTGDIQWSPIPVLGPAGLALLFAAGSGLAWIGARRRRRAGAPAGGRSP